MGGEKFGDAGTGGKFVSSSIFVAEETWSMNEESQRYLIMITRNGDGESSDSLTNFRRRSNYVIFDEFFDA